MTLDIFIRRARLAVVVVVVEEGEIVREVGGGPFERQGRQRRAVVVSFPYYDGVDAHVNNDHLM